MISGSRHSRDDRSNTMEIIQWSNVVRFTWPSMGYITRLVLGSATDLCLSASYIRKRVVMLDRSTDTFNPFLISNPGIIVSIICPSWAVGKFRLRRSMACVFAVSLRNQRQLELSCLFISWRDRWQFFFFLICTILIWSIYRFIKVKQFWNLAVQFALLFYIIPLQLYY